MVTPESAMSVKAIDAPHASGCGPACRALRSHCRQSRLQPPRASGQQHQRLCPRASALVRYCGRGSARTLRPHVEKRGDYQCYTRRSQEVEAWPLDVTVSVRSVPFGGVDAIRPATPKGSQRATQGLSRFVHVPAYPAGSSWTSKRRERSFGPGDLRRLMNRDGIPEVIPSLVHTLQDSADPKFLCSN